MPIPAKLRRIIEERGVRRYAVKKTRSGRLLDIWVLKKAGPRGGHSVGYPRERTRFKTRKGKVRITKRRHKVPRRRRFVY